MSSIHCTFCRTHLCNHAPGSCNFQVSAHHLQGSTRRVRSIQRGRATGGWQQMPITPADPEGVSARSLRRQQCGDCKTLACIADITPVLQSWQYLHRCVP